MKASSMKSLISILVLLTWSLPAHADHGVFSVVKNKAWLIKKGQAERQDARRGQNFEIGDKLITDVDAYVKILMIDKNVLHVGPKTELVLNAYESAGADGTESVISVIYGRVRSALENKYDGKAHRFQIHTAAAVLGVRGTDFLTQHLLDGQTTKAVVFESKVNAQGVNGAGELLGDVQVSAGEMTTIVKGSPPTPPEKIPTETLKKYDAQSLTSEAMTISALAVGAGAAVAGLAIPPVPPVPSLPIVLPGDSKDDDNDAKAEASTASTEEEKKPEIAAVETKKEEEPKKKEEPKVIETATEPPKEENKEEDEDNPWAIAVKAGTLGGSVSLAYPLTGGINLKFDAYNTFGFEFSGGSEDFYRNKVDFSGYGLLLELGAGDAWQLIAGAYLAKNRLEVSGHPVGSETIGGATYTFGPDDIVTGDGEFKNSIAPYLGLGWKMSFFGLFDFVGDLGALYVGELQVNNLDYAGSAGVSAADETAEAEEIVEEINKYKIFPVIRVGLSRDF